MTSISIPSTVKGDDAGLVWWPAWFSELYAHILLDDMKSNDVLIDLSQASFLKYARRRFYGYCLTVCT